MNIYRLLLVTILILGLVYVSSADIIFEDTFDRKIDQQLWNASVTWEVLQEEGGVLSVFDDQGDGRCDGAGCGFGKVEFTNFVLRMDLKIISIDAGGIQYANFVGILFRVTGNDRYYEIRLMPKEGVSKPNHFHWYTRDGDIGTWKRVQLEEMPIDFNADTWYHVQIVAVETPVPEESAFSFQVYLRKRDSNDKFTLISEWTDEEKMHPSGVIGFHTNQPAHFWVDNVVVAEKLIDLPEFAVQPEHSLSTIWGRLKE